MVGVRRTPSGKGPVDCVWLAGSIVASYVTNNAVPTNELCDLIEETFSTLARLKSSDGNGVLNGGALLSPELMGKFENAVPAGDPASRPAVPIENSVAEDHIVCLEDGKRLKMLKRHLRARYGMTVEQYRAKWGLPPDYPAVAPSCAASRSAIAKSKGLGRWSRAARRAAKPDDIVE